ncbi:amino acid permease, putative [Talaromyces stipitatus ATCC 10500]|uniref:Amino acid permease, putative n=1 Tax=Talaromyces stipitatus (strain ATCC 10500 / CBS 375.48 / QM 6759 / NRRL 1006) TaxID=441959 RepID=B8LVH5_TALSN|nr:amino acid permease, putative [Talaromyces stipitatus ATCC 10500]EED23994.1 amino acid permease, putative [Talaromyces stipitatus ATCC 10500]
MDTPSNENSKTMDVSAKDEKSTPPDMEAPIQLADKSTGEFEEVKALRQGLHQRHIQMIALAGTIGTGLFLGSGRAIARSGPLGAFLGYLVMGSVAGIVTLAVGEMGTLVPLNGGIVRYSEFFVDPALAFANGYNLVYSYLVSIPAEIVAASVLVQFWSDLSSAIWITIFGLLMLCTALVFVRVYGELEFFFSMLKILLILGINIMALVITCGGGPNHESIGFRYWHNPGPLVQYLGIDGSLGRFLGVWTSFNNAIYSFSGIETITVAAGETRSPRRAIPQATKRIFIRIFLFYIISIFMVGLVVPSNDPGLDHSSGTASTSPFVIAATRAGIKVVPSIINAVVITSAWSSGNSNLLGGSRVLVGLAMNGRAPKFFTRLNKFSVPWIAISLYGLFMCLGYMSLSSTASTVFDWLQDLVSITTLTNWLTILVTYLRFYYGCKKQGISRKSLPWAAPMQPYISWAALVLLTILLITGGYSTFIKGHWDNETFVSSYINIPLFLILYFGYKYICKTKIVALEDIPIQPFIDVANRNIEPPPKPKKGLNKLNILWE